MASKKSKEAGGAGGVLIFKKKGTGDKRIAIDIASGLVIEEDDFGDFFIYVGGRQFSIQGEGKTLEDFIGA